MPTAKPEALNAAGKAHFDLLRAWCAELGLEWSDVVKEAGGESVGRQSKNRMDKGTASLSTAIKIGRKLQEKQDRMRKRATVGPQAMQLRDWTELGGRLALLDPEEFERTFERVRRLVDGAEAKAEFERLT